MSRRGAREAMVPPDSGRPLRPGRDCPNCATSLRVEEHRRYCTECGHEEPR
ncbi:hypothetical protein SEA_WEST99_37 [Mycobacterium phage West99]|uniref:Uncharacterized protein n=22 Tax=Rosebushvirus TaxID=1982900 RepID=A0A0Y0A9P5_9CAUD|nr:hypothetical protein FDI79_gp37 [Mycobacterium phage Godines]AER48659.1 hypothetical protein ARES_37 [Mycobacterium phage Ares]AIK68811.1 hypothetical protein PBI_LIZLEMON_37 [Mycobacterium phage LizLemon]ALF01322.1 hypothetical protein SEA_TRES_37 [Mycobacterium phage Tres]AMB17351.1 hypothetical protein SEA_GLASS_37 [Mycobacterium phage Glass]AUX82204.1 hypothetical protein SEA_HOLEINONE_37 [Mycobacterium phage Holeinone]AUX82245.1 hypothetical protein SEA_ITSYBITSY1_37 [Mycobacterium ph